MKYLYLLIVFANVVNGMEWKCTVLSNNGASNLLLNTSKNKIHIIDDDGIETNYINPEENDGVLQYDCVEFKNIGLDIVAETKDKLEIGFYLNDELSGGGTCYKNKNR
mgnify:FL=1